MLLLCRDATAATYVSGTIDTDISWDFVGSPYIFTGDVTVSSGATLTIKAGVVVKVKYVSSSSDKRCLILNGDYPYLLYSRFSTQHRMRY